MRPVTQAESGTAWRVSFLGVIIFCSVDQSALRRQDPWRDCNVPMGLPAKVTPD
jgi:hypothetical protein